MKTSVIQIGNSKGIRIPTTILKQCHIENEVDLYINENEIVLKPINSSNPRQGWENFFKKMSLNQDDKLLIPDKIGLDMEDWEG